MPASSRRRIGDDFGKAISKRAAGFIDEVVARRIEVIVADRARGRSIGRFARVTIRQSVRVSSSFPVFVEYFIIPDLVRV